MFQRRASAGQARGPFGPTVSRWHILDPKPEDAPLQYCLSFHWSRDHINSILRL